MEQQDHEQVQEWLYLEPDGELTSTERARLERHLQGCESCRAERRELAALQAMLEAGAIETHPEFVERVMAQLPPAGWEARHPRTWAAAVVAFVTTAGLAAVLTGAAGGADSLPPLAGALATVVELFRSAAVAGSGLLTASWTGVGLVVERSLEESSGGFIAFALLVVGLDLLFLRLLARSLRGRPTPERPAYFEDDRRGR